MKKLLRAALAITGFLAPLLGGPLAAGAAAMNGPALANGAAVPAGSVAATDGGAIGTAGLRLIGVALPEGRGR